MVRKNARPRWQRTLEAGSLGANHVFLLVPRARRGDRAQTRVVALAGAVASVLAEGAVVR